MRYKQISDHFKLFFFHLINHLFLNSILQFDIRLYVLVTSLEPLRLYLYDDGLVRIATEEYSEEPEKLYDSCVHVCNYAINCKIQKSLYTMIIHPSVKATR